MEKINDVLGVLTPILLLCVGIFFLIKLRCFFLRHPIMTFRSAISGDAVEGKSQMRALCLALAGTLGVGNIVGVASSVAIGGYGSIFWMWVCAFVAMVLKYAEIVLALIYRQYDGNGMPYGGAYYYIREFFSSKGIKRMGTFCGGIFAICCILNSVTMGGIIQSNAISTAFYGCFGVPKWICGISIAVLSFFVTIGGSEKISNFTEKLVIVMSVGYTIICLVVLIVYRGRILPSLKKIFFDAFNIKSVGGGVLCFLFSRGFRMGSMRGLMSNEAGCGTAPAAHATSNTKCPAKQGVLGIIEVFVDTIILCTLTALVIIIAGESVLADVENPMMITLGAFVKLLGSWAGVFICICVLLFGFATILCFAHYGSEAIRYFCTGGFTKRIFIFIYTLFVFSGAIFTSVTAWELADLALGIMTVLNLCILCLMSDIVKRETENFIFECKKEKQLKNKKRPRRYVEDEKI